MPHDLAGTARMRLAVFGALVVTFVGCSNDSPGPKTPTFQTIYAVDLSNNLAMFHSTTPQTVERKLAITGMPDGERLVGIDFRDADGKLYGVGTDSRVYTVDTITAAATAVGDAFTPAVDGEHFGMGFDGVDRIRLMSAESGQNLQLDPTSGQVTAVDPVLAYADSDTNALASPAIAATAIDINGTMYGIDWVIGVLVRGDPHTGIITTIGPFDVSTAPCTALGFGNDGQLYVVLTPSGDNNLFTISITDGKTTLIGPIDVFASIQAFAVATGSPSGSRTREWSGPSASFASSWHSSAQPSTQRTRLARAVDRRASGSFICKTDPE